MRKIGRAKTKLISIIHQRKIAISLRCIMYGYAQDKESVVVVVQAFVGLFCGRCAHIPLHFPASHPSVLSLFSPYSRGLFGISTIDAPILEISPADRSLILLVSLFCIVSSQIRIKNAADSLVPAVFHSRRNVEQRSNAIGAQCRYHKREYIGSSRLNLTTEMGISFPPLTELFRRRAKM